MKFSDTIVSVKWLLKNWINGWLSEICCGSTFPRLKSKFAKDRGRLRAKPTAQCREIKIDSRVYEIIECWIEQRQFYKIPFGWRNLDTYFLCFNVEEPSGFSEDYWPSIFKNGKISEAFRINSRPFVYGFTLQEEDYLRKCLTVYFCSSETESNLLKSAAQIEFLWNE